MVNMVWETTNSGGETCCLTSTLKTLLSWGMHVTIQNPFGFAAGMLKIDCGKLVSKIDIHKVDKGHRVLFDRLENVHIRQMKDENNDRLPSWDIVNPDLATHSSKMSAVTAFVLHVMFNSRTKNNLSWAFTHLR